jgi:hypothetical protein
MPALAFIFAISSKELKREELGRETSPNSILYEAEEILPHDMDSMIYRNVLKFLEVAQYGSYSFQSDRLNLRILFHVLPSPYMIL